MNISTITAKSRVAEVATAGKKITAVFEASTLKEDTTIVGMIEELGALIAELTSVMHGVKPESILEESDERRDDVLRALFYLTRGLTFHPTPAVSNAAQKVFALLAHYGLSITRESYDIETALVNALLEGMSSEEMEEAAAALTGVEQLLANLQTTQQAFEAASLAYSQSKAEDKEQRSGTAIKKDVLKLINEKLLPYLEVMTMVNSAAFEPFATTVATLIDESNSGVKRRGKRDE